MKIERDVTLAPYTTFMIGGQADFFARATSERDLEEAAAFARDRATAVRVLGGGSNTLAADAGFRGLVIKMEMKGISFVDNQGSVLATAAAGEDWDEFVARTVQAGAWGLENLSAIPGMVGAAPVQNIGAYGTEVMDVIESVRAIDLETGEARTFTNQECGFTYRESVFKSPEYRRFAIVAVTFRLSKRPQPNLSYKDVKEFFARKGVAAPTQAEIRAGVREIRHGKFPDLTAFGTAGSFWKNPIICREHYDEIAAKYPGLPSFPAAMSAGSPDAAGGRVKVPLAWILDRVCGLKGYKQGKVALYEKQPLVLVSLRGATASEIDSFAAEVAAKVEANTAIQIEREVRVL